MDLNGKVIEKAAKQHALEVLGEEQYNDPEMEVPKESIMEDFKAGVEWHIRYLMKQEVLNKYK